MSVVGLDYTAVLSMAEVMGIDVTPAMMLKIRALEHEVLKQVQKEESPRGK